MVGINRLKEPKTSKEVDLQKACWKILQGWPIPEGRLSDYSYHVPNGTHLAGDRQGRARSIASLKAQGFKNGVSDLVIAYPIWESGAAIAYIRWAGAYIELKMPKRYPTPEQEAWLERMGNANYFTAVVWGEEEFRFQVVAFLAGVEPVGFTRQRKKK